MTSGVGLTSGVSSDRGKGHFKDRQSTWSDTLTERNASPLSHITKYDDLRPLFTRGLHLPTAKGLVTNYGEGGGEYKTGGGHVKFYPYEKGGGWGWRKKF